MMNICVPVLRRYDLFRNLVLSLERSSVRPTKLYVVDNGQAGAPFCDALDRLTDIPFEIFTPIERLGVAASWNWFIRNVPEKRLIVNDDIEFGTRTLERFARSDADIAWAEGEGFSCFLLRDSCVEKIGDFDETISPGYAYYEDDDYLQRIDGRGTRSSTVKTENIDSGILHRRSSTLTVCSPEELEEHHRRFKIAQANYMKKWNISHQEMFQ